MWYQHLDGMENKQYVFIYFLLHVLIGEEFGVKFILGRNVVLIADFDLRLKRDTSGHEPPFNLKEKTKKVLAFCTLLFFLN